DAPPEAWAQYRVRKEEMQAEFWESFRKSVEQVAAITPLEPTMPADASASIILPAAKANPEPAGPLASRLSNKRKMNRHPQRSIEVVRRTPPEPPKWVHPHAPPPASPLEGKEPKEKQAIAIPVKTQQNPPMRAAPVNQDATPKELSTAPVKPET